jgi:hypothetical protein
MTLFEVRQGIPRVIRLKYLLCGIKVPEKVNVHHLLEHTEVLIVLEQEMRGDPSVQHEDVYSAKVEDRLINEVPT